MVRIGQCNPEDMKISLYAATNKLLDYLYVGYAYYKIVQPILFQNELSATELSPLMCAGITTYNAL